MSICHDKITLFNEYVGECIITSTILPAENAVHPSKPLISSSACPEPGVVVFQPTDSTSPISVVSRRPVGGLGINTTELVTPLPSRCAETTSCQRHCQMTFECHRPGSSRWPADPLASARLPSTPSTPSDSSSPSSGPATGIKGICQVKRNVGWSTVLPESSAHRPSIRQLFSGQSLYPPTRNLTMLKNPFLDWTRRLYDSVVQTGLR
ncbi:unnamed protein product [Protopolystoma xenopodis]|uniref:Uncharacterized protein n=1 Tax=Protopolystoma xenopodis TaxID=117903 RepID=A0A3S5BLM3_9PLAT|nr:unnamed protein product [Protopolystoma xenopodis]